ncbi:uncharacterized protein METZ01_LOCUS446162, partial [marine metagenome]
RRGRHRAGSNVGSTQPSPGRISGTYSHAGI